MRSHESRPSRRAWAMVLLVVGYAAVGRAALTVPLVPISAIPIAPTAGLALAGLMLLGFRAWPAVFAGGLAVNLLLSGSARVALGVATGDSLAAILGACLLRRVSGGIGTFERVPGVVRFGAVAALLVPAVSTVGAIIASAGAGAANETMGVLASAWWVASACGTLVLTPALVLWVAMRSPFQRIQRPAEAGALAGTLMLLGVMIFGDAGVLNSEFRLPAILVFPVLLWAAIRFGSVGASVAMFATSAFALWGLVHGTVFVRPTPFASYQLLAWFTSVGSLTALAVAAVARERNRVHFLMLRAGGALNVHPPRREADLVRMADRLVETIEENRRSQRYARVLADTVQDALILVDARFRVRAANPAFYRTFWLSPTEVDGRPLFELGGRMWDVPELRERVAATLASDAAPESLELSRVFPSIGTRTIRIDARRVEDGAESGLVLLALRDFTESRRIEQALLATERRFETVAETAGDGILIMTALGSITFANPSAARMLGVAPDDLIGKPFESLVPERLRDVQRDELLRLVSTAGETPLERRGLRADGREFPMEVTWSSGRVGDERFVTAIVRDVTERKRSEQMIRDLNADLERRIAKRTEQLERSNRELRQFASIAAHDLQEPLRTVSSYLELIARRYRGRLDAEADEFIGFATEAADWMRQLVRDLLAYSRVRAEELKLTLLESESALERALANLQTVIDESGARIEHGPLPAVVADESRLVQLFQNLIGNALKFRRDDPPRIRVHAEAADGFWRFAVTDNGIGIEARHRERIFQVFQRLHPRGEYPGTGIGLALCRKIVEEHRGRMGVDSVPGMGSEFHFTLPVPRRPGGPRGRSSEAPDEAAFPADRKGA